MLVIVCPIMRPSADHHMAIDIACVVLWQAQSGRHQGQLMMAWFSISALSKT
jgi:hypothetical protein